jgi:glycerate-2-kinase
VIGDDLSVIGSGPTVLDSTTVDDAAAVLKRFGIAVPHLTETPKTQVNAQNVIVGSNRQSIDAAAKKAKALGYRPIVLSTTIDGETREIARMHAALAREMLARGGTRACLSGGETTVTIRGTDSADAIRNSYWRQPSRWSPRRSHYLQRRHRWYRRAHRRGRSHRRRFHLAPRRRTAPQPRQFLADNDSIISLRKPAAW